MLNLREMAQTNSNIRKLDETKKLPKQPYCVGCENKIDDWDVYVDMREEVASTHATCPHCGLMNYEDSKDIHPSVVVLIFIFAIPLSMIYGAERLGKEFGIVIDEDSVAMVLIVAWCISFLLYWLLGIFRVSDLKKRMEEIEERS